MAAITICSDFGPPGNSPNSLIFAVLILQFFIQNLRETLNCFQKYTGFKSMAMENWKEYDKCQKKICKRASLVVQWLRICLVMQGTPVWSLVQEDLTCLRATKHVSHKSWVCALESGSRNYLAHEPQLLNEACAPGAPAPQLEKLLQWEAQAPQLEKARTATETQHSQINNKTN